MKYYYDVVLSFAGEDREYVEECADILTALGIKVFYDSYEQDVLWGKDLYTFLADIYSNKARYAIVFISQHYVKKCWTKHEFKFINERMFNSETEYLLPVFLDDTKLCGIPETQGYLLELEQNTEYVLEFDMDLDMPALFKSVGIRYEVQETDFFEQIIRYIKIAVNVLATKVFVFINLRSYLTDLQMQELIKEISYQDVKGLFIENHERSCMEGGMRYIIDRDGCEIY